MSLLSKNLKLLRNEANLSTSELSNRTGIREDLIIGFENDTFIPNELQLEILCKELKVPYEDISTRDFEVERKEATKNMRNSENRKNYNWYFGDKKTFLLLLLYVIYFLVGVSVIVLILVNQFKDLNIDYMYAWWQQEQPLNYFPIYFVYFLYRKTYILFLIFGIGVVIFFCLLYFRTHEFVFRIWYIFLISLFISLLPFIGIFGSITYFVYCFIRLIRGKY